MGRSSEGKLVRSHRDSRNAGKGREGAAQGEDNRDFC
jgi:hypothetical protein